MIYLFHGDEAFEKSERIAALKRSLGDLVDINTIELDGRQVDQAELQHHCDVLPFLGEKRLVVVNGLLARFQGGENKDGASAFETWLADYLPTLPDTTMLVLNEPKKLPGNHPIVRTVRSLGDKGEVVLFEAPSLKKGELARWVEQRARKKGARLERGVAANLASFIGPDLRLIDSELEKLAVYAGDRPITMQDVKMLVPYAKEASIFDMVDALGHRRTAQAFRLLAQLRNQGAHPMYLLTMIVRQFRIIMQVKDLSATGGMSVDDLAGALKLHPFPTRKALEQSRHYSAEQLARIYDRLLETDLAIKTGRLEANLALDLLVVELARA
ncbi:MAG: DNA polymerase III subunit delta [Caldilineae bacterium]|nr:MAG: DNA polymerase III subunit delta [Caldilineae bacterium]